MFTDNFDVENASPKDYFDLMFSPEVVGDMVRHTNNYARWKMEQKGEVDALWYDVTENELRAYLGVNIIMGISELPSYKDYWSRDKFIGNEGDTRKSQSIFMLVTGKMNQRGVTKIMTNCTKSNL